MFMPVALSRTHGPGARGAVTRLACWAALLAVACGESQSTASDEDAALPPVADDSCARFGFEFEQGGCPDAECAEPLCNCPTPIQCISGMNERCMVGLDCTAACAADMTQLFVCSVAIEPCTSDADCASGLCVDEPAATRGECESGERGARCRNDHDCQVGNCVAGTGGNRACSPGEASDLCNRDSDCQSAHCALSSGALSGECE